MLAKNSWVRIVYLYLFSLLGLVLVVIGAVRLVDLGLKTYIFKEADKEEFRFSVPALPPARVLEKEGTEKLKIAENSIKLTEEEKSLLRQWETDYKNWREMQSKVDFQKSRRQREASSALAFIIVGLPLYFYHWKVVQKDKKQNDS